MSELTRLTLVEAREGLSARRFSSVELTQAFLAAIEAELVRHLGVAMGHARKDGQVALEPVYCLGLCAVGPNAMVDGCPVARIDGAAVERIAAGVEA